MVPVKRLPLAKTRLDVDPERRRQAVLTMADHVVRTLLGADAVDRVIVVTDDPVVSRHAIADGADVIGQGNRPGLNAAIMRGLAVASCFRRPPPVAAVMADLAYLASDDVDTALVRTLELHAAFVSDRAGTGTTMIAAVEPARCVPLFGPDSAWWHRCAGLRPVQSQVPSLRRDVDVLGDIVRV